MKQIFIMLVQIIDAVIYACGGDDTIWYWENILKVVNILMDKSIEIYDHCIDNEQSFLSRHPDLKKELEKIKKHEDELLQGIRQKKTSPSEAKKEVSSIIKEIKEFNSKVKEASKEDSKEEESKTENTLDFIYDDDLFTEAYYGKDEILLKVENVIDSLLKKMKAEPAGEYTNSPENKLLCSLFEKKFGFKKVYITWKYSAYTNLPIYTYPHSLVICADGVGIRTDRKKGWYDTTHKRHCYISACTNVAEYNLTAQEYTAILLHEIGHNFDVSPYRLVDTIISMIVAVIEDINIIKGPGALWQSPTGRLYPVPRAPLNTVNTIIGNSAVGNVITGVTDKVKHAIIGFMMKSKVVRRVSEYAKRLHGVIAAGTNLLFLPIEILALPQLVLMSPLTHAMNLLTRKKEVFADSFATVYGYGPEIISGLSKISTYGTSISGIMFKDNSKLHPTVKAVFDVVADINSVSCEVINLLVGNGASHGDNATRLESNIDMLKTELSRTDLPEHMKRELEKEIARCTQVLHTILYDDTGGDGKRTNIAMTVYVRHLIYEIFEGASDYVAKLFPSYYANTEKVMAESVSNDTMMMILEKYYNGKISDSDLEYLTSVIYEK